MKMKRFWGFSPIFTKKPLGQFQKLFSRFGQTRNISLAYQLHSPPEFSGTTKADPQHAPIIIMHGLFGSKQNSRSISKAIARDLRRPVYAVVRKPLYVDSIRQL